MSNNLTISLNNSSNDKKEQATAIEKKLKKIENLQQQLIKLSNTIDISRKLYNENCLEEERGVWKEKEQLIIMLFKRFQQKGFSLWQKEMIEGKLMSEIDEIFSSDYDSDIAIEIRENLDDLTTSAMDKDQKEMMEYMAKEFIKNIGLDIDEANFSFEDLKDKDFQERIRETQEEKFKQEYQEFHYQEKDQQHEEKQNKINTTNKDFQKLYKSLAKKAHPDLVIDPLENEIREVWMKRLSTAWEDRDYYELLILQNEISVDDKNAILLTDSQIKPLLQELNRKIATLESEKEVLKYDDPENAFYFENFNARSEKGIFKKILEYKNAIYNTVVEVQEECKKLKTQKSTKDLLVEIRASSTSHLDLFDFFD